VDHRDRPRDAGRRERPSPVNTFNLSAADWAKRAAGRTFAWPSGPSGSSTGFLQFQASMPLGMANGVVATGRRGHAELATRADVRLASAYGTNHPIALAVGTAWIQVGIGSS